MMNTSYSIMSRPSLTTIHVPVYEMGAMAIRLMTKMLNEEEIDQKAVPVVTQIITRNTTK
jgi:LacI family transcriptional regulator